MNDVTRTSNTVSMSPELADKAHTLMCEIVGAWNTGGIVTHEVRGAVRQWLIDVADYEQRAAHEPAASPPITVAPDGDKPQPPTVVNGRSHYVSKNGTVHSVHPLDPSALAWEPYYRDLARWWEARASQPPAPEWQPIETAPLDGTPVLVSNDERDGAWIAYYNPVYSSGYRPENAWSSLMLNMRWHTTKWASTVPTKWMPIPAVATSTKGTEAP